MATMKKNTSTNRVIEQPTLWAIPNNPPSVLPGFGNKPFYKGFTFSTVGDVGDVPSVTSATPVAFIFDGKVYSLNSWRDLLKVVCEALGTKKLKMVVDKDRLMFPFYRDRKETKVVPNPYQRHSSGIWIYTVVSADGALQGAWNLCKECGAPMERIVVIMRV